MGLIAKKNGENNYSPTTPGTYQAVCYGVIDIGTHDVVDMKGNKKKKWQVIILWELPTERIEIDGNSRPRGVSKFYTNSLHEKSTLFAHLNSWRGRPFTEKELEGFDLFTIIRANCLLQITNKKKKDGSIRDDVSGVMSLLKGMVKHEPENKIVTYSIADNGLNIPEHVPAWIKAFIEKSDEYQAIKHASESPELASVQDDYIPEDEQPIEDEDIPF